MQIKTSIKRMVKNILLKITAHRKLNEVILKVLKKLYKYINKAILILSITNYEKNKNKCLITVEREDKNNLINKLLKYDIISFDIFDTLILRSIANPKDLFELMGLQHNVQLFKRVRIESERDARKSSTNIDHDVNIDDIYNLIEKRSGIAKQEGINLGIALEKKCCFANPYMYDIFKILKENGKKIIVTSDMYLDKSTIIEILNNCGYDPDYIFISNNEGRMKEKGGLQKLIDEKFKNLSKIHIGDNYKSDIEESKKVGWDTYYYKNVHDIYSEYRIKGMSTLGGSFYNGILEDYLYNGNWNKNKFFTFGFKYLGILICAYCEWLNETADKNNATKILFPSRDMYIVQQVYNKFFRKYDNEYVQISRMASIYMDFNKSTEMLLNYLKDYLKVEQKYKVKEVLYKIGLICITEFLSEVKIDEDEKFDIEQFNKLKILIYSKKDIVEKYYNEHKKAALHYFSNCVDGHDNVLFADTNGRCTSLLGITHLLNDNGINTKVIGSFLYSVSDRGYVEAKFSNDSLNVFLFSCIYNINFFAKFRKYAIQRTEILEALFSAPKGTLKTYSFDNNGNVKFEYTVENMDKQYLNDILAGVLLFAELYKKYNDPQLYHLLPIDAWLPIDTVLENDEIIKMFKDLKINMELGA